MVAGGELFEEILPKFVAFFGEHFHHISFPLKRVRMRLLHADFKLDEASSRELLLKFHLLSSSLEQVLPEVCNVKVHVSHRQVRLGLGIVEHGELKKFIILNIGDDRGLISPIRIVGNCLIL